MKIQWKVLFTSLCSLAFSLPASLPAQTMADYTAYPNFLNQTVPPNILFIVDMGNKILPAAYTGPNHHYPISFKTGTPTQSTYAANITFDDGTGPGADMTSVDQAGAVINTATTALPSDTFNSLTSYYGMFDPLRCYVTDSNSFNYSSVKATVAAACAVTEWDGNFLNWLTMRKKEVLYQVLVGGTSLPASANTDGTANTLAGEGKTGENGSTDSCTSNSKSCWRYVKFVPASTLSGRVPTSLPSPVVTGTNMDATAADPGRFFGIGDGDLFVNDDATPDPFDASSGNQYAIVVDLTTEPDVPSGTGSESDHCNVGQPGFAGHLVCYKREHSLGLFQKLQLANMHVSVMFVNAVSGQGARVDFEFDDNFNPSAITGIRNEKTSAESPLAEALYEGLCLYRKAQGPCYSNSGASSVGYTGSTGVNGDPFYFASLNQMVSCCRNFVLMISPGSATADGDTPDLQVPFGDLFSGTNIGLTSSGVTGDRLDDVAYYGKLNDIRGPSLTGDQTVTFYGVNAMGGAAGATLLASAAKYGGFEDQNSDNLPDAGGQACTYPAGSNLGTGAGTSSPEWDKDQNCVPDTFFDANEGGDLEAQINAAIAAILKEASSGSAASVLASSSTGEGAIYQSFFFPSSFEGQNEITWTGYTRGLFLDSFGNLREDTNSDGSLVYGDDLIVRTRFDTSTSQVVIDKYVDVSPADGQADSSTPSATVGLKNVSGIWEAGKRLALTPSCSRRLLTWVDLNHNQTVDGGEQMPFEAACGPFGTDTSTILSPYLRAGAAPYTATNIIDFIRGSQIVGMRDRQLTVGGSLTVWKLGDAIHAQPIVVGTPTQRFDVIYGDASYTAYFDKYKNRRQVAYLGANDGMLHAFNAGFYHRGDDPSTNGTEEHGWFTRTPTNNSSGPLLGDELWGFIPQELLPHLQWLADPNYTHVYYVDLTPKVTDVRIFTADADHPNGWGTILMGGFRMGGSCGNCPAGSAPPMSVTGDLDNNAGTPDETRSFYSAYFVLDVTNPEKDPVLLWSFSSADLGLTTMIPSMLRVTPAASAMTDNTDAKWYMVMGSGATSYDGDTDQAGTLYAIDLAQGPGLGNGNVKTMVAETMNSMMGNTLTMDRDFDYRVDVTFFGSVIDDGSGPWRGKLYRLTMNDCLTPCLPSVWGIDDGGGKRVPTEILDTFPSSGTTLELGPITSTPAVTIDDANKLWVFSGTGRFFSQADKSNTEQQYFVGVKDSVMNNACTESTRTNCHDDDLVDVSAAVVCQLAVGTCGSGTNQVSGVAGATDFPSLVSTVASKDGWYTTLSTSGERSVTRPLVFGGMVLFPTFTPDSDVCNQGGESTLYALYYRTGSAFSSPVIGVSTSGSNKNVNRSVSLGKGLASQAVVHLGKGSTHGKVTAYVQKSDGELLSMDISLVGALSSRFISWYDQRS